jgi:hypothetical protein
MRGFGIAFQRCQRLQPPFRVRIRKLELHQHAGNHAANATVGLEVVEISLVGKPGLSAAVDINQRHLAVAGILDKEEPAIAFASVVRLDLHAGLGLGVVHAAAELLPVRLQHRRFRQEVGPGIAGHLSVWLMMSNWPSSRISPISTGLVR